MKLYGQPRLHCDRCGESIEIYFTAQIDTISSLKQRARKKAREQKWIITRDDRCYCEKCAKQIKLRNSGKKE